MIRLPTISTLTATLFPVTTLFRSGLRRRRKRPLAGRHRRVHAVLRAFHAHAAELPARGAAAWRRRPQLRRLDLVHHQGRDRRSEEHTSELQSLMRISYAVFCLKKNNKHTK